MKLLVWLVLVAVVYLAIRSKARRMRENLRNAVNAEFEARAATQKESSAPAENMVACTYCHIYLPASDALNLVTPSATHYFCSEEHLRLHHKASPDVNIS